MLYREFRFPRIRDVFNNGCPLKCPFEQSAALPFGSLNIKSFLSHMVNHAPPIRYFVAISRPKPCPLLWEEIEVVAGSESHAQHLCFLLRERYNAMVLCPSVMPH